MPVVEDLVDDFGDVLYSCTVGTRVVFVRIESLGLGELETGVLEKDLLESKQPRDHISKACEEEYGPKYERNPDGNAHFEHFASKAEQILKSKKCKKKLKNDKKLKLMNYEVEWKGKGKTTGPAYRTVGTHHPRTRRSDGGKLPGLDARTRTEFTNIPHLPLPSN